MTLSSSSDHSDIVTLGDLKEDDHVEVDEEAAANEELYLGTSCSSQYAFSAAETGELAATHTHTHTHTDTVTRWTVPMSTLAN